MKVFCSKKSKFKKLNINSMQNKMVSVFKVFVSFFPCDFEEGKEYKSIFFYEHAFLLLE